MAMLARDLTVGVSYCLTRLHHSIPERPASFQRDSAHDSLSLENHGFESGDSVTPRERGYRGNTPRTDGARLLQLLYCCAQKGWWFEPGFGLLPLALRVSKFRMLTLKSILSHIRTGDWL